MARAMPKSVTSVSMRPAIATTSNVPATDTATAIETISADRHELPAVIRGARGRLLLLGLLLAPLSLIPFVNLLAPIYAGIAFTYLCLNELAAYRSRNAGPVDYR